MTRSLSRLQALLLGSVFVAALAIAGWTLLHLSQRQGWPSDSMTATASFQDVNGLQVGTRVHLQGVDVGEVAAVVLPEVAGQPVTVHLRLAGHLQARLGDDTRVRIARDNPLGERVVRLLPGRPEAARLQDGAVLAAAEAPDLVDGLAQAAGRLNDLLRELEGAARALRQGEQSFTQDLAQSARRLNQVLTRLDQNLADVEAGHGTLGKLLRDDGLYEELTGTLRELKGAAYDVRRGEGTVGRLMKDGTAYEQTLEAVKEVRGLVSSVKQNSDALKSLPVVRSYVVDANKELVRPDRERLRKVFAASDLFEPGKALLTDEGRTRLDRAADWVKEHPEAEVVIAGIASPREEASFAQTLTQKQSEAVRDYLVQNAANRTGWWFWNRRPLRAVGCGTQPPAQPEADALPPARVEIVLFLPQK